MDLKNNQITVGELMKNSKARAVLEREFKEYAHSPMIKMASRMTLSKLLEIAKKHVEPQRIKSVLNEIEKL